MMILKGPAIYALTAAWMVAVSAWAAPAAAYDAVTQHVLAQCVTQGEACTNTCLKARPGQASCTVDCATAAGRCARGSGQQDQPQSPQ